MADVEQVVIGPLRRLIIKDYPDPHCGLEGVHGGSRPRDECAPDGDDLPSPQKVSERMEANYGRSENLEDSAWIDSKGIGLAPHKDHQESATHVLALMDVPIEMYFTPMTATLSMVDLGMVRYTQFQDIHAFTIPDEKFTDRQKEAIVKIMSTQKAQAERSGSRVNFSIDVAKVTGLGGWETVSLSGKEIAKLLDLNKDYWDISSLVISSIYRDYPDPHCGLEGVHGGSRPRGECAAETADKENGKWSEERKSKAITIIEEEFNPTEEISLETMDYNFWVLPDGRIVDVSEHATLGSRLHRRFREDEEFELSEYEKKWGTIKVEELINQGFMRTNFHHAGAAGKPVLMLQVAKETITSEIKQTISDMYWAAYAIKNESPNIALDWLDKSGKHHSMSTSGLSGELFTIEDINRRLGFRIDRSYPDPHCGLEGVHGGSRPRGECGPGGEEKLGWVGNPRYSVEKRSKHAWAVMDHRLKKPAYAAVYATEKQANDWVEEQNQKWIDATKDKEETLPYLLESIKEHKVYHGGPKDIEEITTAQLGKTTGNPTAVWGAFFTPSEQEAERYVQDFHGGEGQVYETTVTLENPYRMSFSEYDKYVDLDLSKGNLEAQMDTLRRYAQRLKDKLLSKGYDGIIIGERGRRRSQEIVVFDPEQIGELAERDYPDPHCGLEGVHGGSRPRDECAGDLASVIKDIDEIIGRGQQRRDNAKDPAIKGLRPAVADWLYETEKQRLQELQNELRRLTQEVMGDPKERVKLKRQLRQLGLEFDPEAPIEDLIDALGGEPEINWFRWQDENIEHIPKQMGKKTIEGFRYEPARWLGLHSEGMGDVFRELAKWEFWETGRADWSYIEEKLRRLETDMDRIRDYGYIFEDRLAPVEDARRQELIDKWESVPGDLPAVLNAARDLNIFLLQRDPVAVRMAIEEIRWWQKHGREAIERAGADKLYVYVPIIDPIAPEWQRTALSHFEHICLEPVEPGRLHATLIWSENCPDEFIAKILNNTSLPIPFEIEVASLCILDNGENLTLAWHINPDPALIRLQEELHRAVTNEGLPISEYSDPKIYKPHISIAYNLESRPEELPAIEPFKISIDRFVLSRDDYDRIFSVRLPEDYGKVFMIERGGPDSGYYDPHCGPPEGQRGGSSPRDTCATGEEMERYQEGRKLRKGIRERLPPIEEVTGEALPAAIRGKPIGEAKFPYGTEITLSSQDRFDLSPNELVRAKWSQVPQDKGMLRLELAGRFWMLEDDDMKVAYIAGGFGEALSDQIRSSGQPHIRSAVIEGTFHTERETEAGIRTDWAFGAKDINSAISNAYSLYYTDPEGFANKHPEASQFIENVLNDNPEFRPENMPDIHQVVAQLPSEAPKIPSYRTDAIVESTGQAHSFLWAEPGGIQHGAHDYGMYEHGGYDPNYIHHFSENADAAVARAEASGANIYDDITEMGEHRTYVAGEEGGFLEAGEQRDFESSRSRTAVLRRWLKNYREEAFDREGPDQSLNPTDDYRHYVADVLDQAINQYGMEKDVDYIIQWQGQGQGDRGGEYDHHDRTDRGTIVIFQGSLDGENFDEIQVNDQIGANTPIEKLDPDYTGERYISEERPAVEYLAHSYLESATLGTIIHENGHRFDSLHDSMPSQRGERLLSEPGYLNRVMRYVSEYATDNGKETVAESFTLYNHPDFERAPIETRAIVHYVLFGDEDYEGISIWDRDFRP